MPWFWNRGRVDVTNNPVLPCRGLLGQAVCPIGLRLGRRIRSTCQGWLVSENQFAKIFKCGTDSRHGAAVVTDEMWRELRQKVQRRADALLGEEAAHLFLHRGKMYGKGGFAGMYVETHLCSISGCSYVLALLDALEQGKSVCVAIVDEDGNPPEKLTPLALKRNNRN